MKRKFHLAIVVLALSIGSIQLRAQSKFQTDRFLYGASVYPEMQTKEEQIKMLDLFKKAGMTVLRVAESSWGNLEPAPGKFEFGWLKDFLDEMHKRDLKAILGTSSYIVPQWLAANHPEILWQFQDGSSAHPMGRHAMSRNHPIFRAELGKYITALGAAFKDHPAVIGWQLDNEIEWNLASRIDYNKVTKDAWVKWLEKNYKTKDEFNRRLSLVQWGLQIDSLKNVFLPTQSNDGNIPAIRWAHVQFQKDDILDYFRWQKSLLQNAGVKQWITSDLNMVYHTIADEYGKDNPFDIMSLNEYQPTENAYYYWSGQAMFHNIHRSSNNNGRFIVAETRIGPTGGDKIGNEAASHKQFVTWMLHPAAFGAVGVMHWTGNRFTGGHWPHWGGILDWSGNPEPDYKWVSEIGAFYKKWGNVLTSTGVNAKAAIITDFNQRALLEIYAHIPSEGSQGILMEAFDAFHRRGIGVDALHPQRAVSYDSIKNYDIIVIAAAPCLDATPLSPALKTFVEKGGLLIVAPFTGYQTRDGVFRNNGFAADLSELTGSLVRTVRLLGEQKQDSSAAKVAFTDKSNNEKLGIGMDGFTEILEVNSKAEILARFSTNEEVINNLPAIVSNKIGKGNVVKIAFWPADFGFVKILGKYSSPSLSYLKQELPIGVHAVPRSDGSLFIINTFGEKKSVALNKSMKDRITGTPRANNFELQPYELVWLE